MNSNNHNKTNLAKYLLPVLLVAAILVLVTCDNPVYSKIVERVYDFRESQLALPPAVPSLPVIDTSDATKLIVS